MNLDFHPINPGSSDDGNDEESKETKEFKLVERYEEGLLLMSRGKENEAWRIFSEILGSELLKCSPQGGNFDGEQPNITLKVKYLCYKNLALLEKARGNYAEATSLLIKALSLDSGDITVWFELGETGGFDGNHRLQRECLMEVVKHDPQNLLAHLQLIPLLTISYDVTRKHSIFLESSQLASSFRGKTEDSFVDLMTKRTSLSQQISGSESQSEIEKRREFRVISKTVSLIREGKPILWFELVSTVFNLLKAEMRSTNEYGSVYQFKYASSAAQIGSRMRGMERKGFYGRYPKDRRVSNRGTTHTKESLDSIESEERDLEEHIKNVFFKLLLDNLVGGSIEEYQSMDSRRGGVGNSNEEKIQQLSQDPADLLIRRELSDYASIYSHAERILRVLCSNSHQVWPLKFQVVVFNTMELLVGIIEFDSELALLHSELLISDLFSSLSMEDQSNLLQSQVLPPLIVSRSELQFQDSTFSEVQTKMEDSYSLWNRIADRFRKASQIPDFDSSSARKISTIDAYITRFRAGVGDELLIRWLWVEFRANLLQAEFDYALNILSVIYRELEECAGIPGYGNFFIGNSIHSMRTLNLRDVSQFQSKFDVKLEIHRTLGGEESRNLSIDDVSRFLSLEGQDSDRPEKAILSDDTLSTQDSLRILRALYDSEMSSSRTPIRILELSHAIFVKAVASFRKNPSSTSDTDSILEAVSLFNDILCYFSTGSLEYPNQVISFRGCVPERILGEEHQNRLKFIVGDIYSLVKYLQGSFREFLRDEETLRRILCLAWVVLYHGVMILGDAQGIPINCELILSLIHVNLAIHGSCSENEGLFLLVTENEISTFEKHVLQAIREDENVAKSVEEYLFGKKRKTDFIRTFLNSMTQPGASQVPVMDVVLSYWLMGSTLACLYKVDLEVVGIRCHCKSATPALERMPPHSVKIFEFLETFLQRIVEDKVSVNDRVAQQTIDMLRKAVESTNEDDLEPVRETLYYLLGNLLSRVQPEEPALATSFLRIDLQFNPGHSKSKVQLAHLMRLDVYARLKNVMFLKEEEANLLVQQLEEMFELCNAALSDGYQMTIGECWVICELLVNSLSLVRFTKGTPENWLESRIVYAIHVFAAVIERPEVSNSTAAPPPREFNIKWKNVFGPWIFYMMVGKLQWKLLKFRIFEYGIASLPDIVVDVEALLRNLKYGIDCTTNAEKMNSRFKTDEANVMRSEASYAFYSIVAKLTKIDFDIVHLVDILMKLTGGAFPGAISWSASQQENAHILAVAAQNKIKEYSLYYANWNHKAIFNLYFSSPAQSEKRELIDRFFSFRPLQQLWNIRRLPSDQCKPWRYEVARYKALKEFFAISFKQVDIKSITYIHSKLIKEANVPFFLANLDILAMYTMLYLLALREPRDEVTLVNVFRQLQGLVSSIIGFKNPAHLKKKSTISEYLGTEVSQRPLGISLDDIMRFKPMEWFKYRYKAPEYYDPPEIGQDEVAELLQVVVLRYGTQTKEANPSIELGLNMMEELANVKS